MSRRSRNDFLIPTLGVLFDSAAILAAFVASYLLRFNTEILRFLPLTEDTPTLGSYLRSALVVVPVWLMLFNARSMYGSRRNVNVADEFVRIVKAATLGMLVIMSAAFFYRAFSYSRVVFVLLWVSAVVLIFTGRILLRLIESLLYRNGRDLRDAVLIGAGPLANQVYSALHHHRLLGYRFVGYFADTPAKAEYPLSTGRYLGSLDAVPDAIDSGETELAVIALEREHQEKLRRLIENCEGLNVEFMMVPDILDLMASRMKVEEIECIPFIRLKGVPMTTWGRILKRLVDIVVSILLLTISSPFILLAAIAIKFDSPGPILFTQERVGLDGRKFLMFKFRSMRIGAEKYDHEAGLGVKNDPRTTRVGSVLRATSFDELPQLLNVLRGEMSLVGPRPERTFYVEKFKDLVPKYLDRHRVKTGMTGWAQVNGFRGDSSLEGRIKFDIYYIENWSLGFDMKILMKTIGAVLFPHMK